MKYFLVLISFLFIACAQTPKTGSSSAIQAEGNKVVIQVDGMVCDFCAQGIDRHFMKKKDVVKKVDLDLDKATVTLTYHAGKTLTLDQIKETLKAAGGYTLRK